MAALLVAMGVMAVLMTAAMPVWKQAAQREKEQELVFRGEQYARAVGLFQRKYANAFPPNIDTLVQQRFLRKKYKDPITDDDFAPLLQGQVAGNTPGSGSATAARPGQTPTQQQPQQQPGAAGRGQAGSPFGGAPGASTTPTGGAPAGGLIGVTSKSKEKSIRVYKGRTHYNEWAFVYTPPAQAPGGAGGAGVPGAGPNPTPGRGQRGNQPPQNPNGPFPGGQQRGRGPAGGGVGGRGPFGQPPGGPGGQNPFPPGPGR
jgi:type II secretory pathway pseudopilin PulG